MEELLEQQVENITKMVIRPTDDRSYSDILIDHSFGTSVNAVRLPRHHFTASQCVFSQMCSIDIFVDLQPIDYNLKAGPFDLPARGV